MKCATCGTKTQSKRKAHSLKIAGVLLKGDVAVNVCGKCGTSLLDVGELEQFEINAAASLAEHGVCTGEAFRFIRKALGMRASDVASTLGTTPETVSRWETGQRDVDRHVFALLAELAIAAAEGRPSPAARFKTLASAKSKRVSTIKVTTRSHAA